VPLFTGAVFAIFLWLPGPFHEFKYLIAGLMLMFVVGLRDDLVPLPANLKLASQLIPFILLIQWGDFKLLSMYEIVPWLTFNEVIAWTITLFVFVVITNSINLIDGLDGLAGALCLIILTSYGIWFIYAGMEIPAYICFSLVGSIIAFLFFNWQPSRIFMGDTGALTLGLVCAAMTILFINSNHNLEHLHPAKITSGVTTAVCIMIIPLTDTLRVFIIRISSGRSPFSADTNHIHHLLLRSGLSHSGAVKVLCLANLFFIVMAFIGHDWPPQILLATVILTAAGSISMLVLFLKLRFKSKTQKAAVQ
jgi:UDP-GlcNAc:undecaprenyl-phosphate GlcNAc-1-phosphate transferase